MTAGERWGHIVIIGGFAIGGATIGALIALIRWATP